MERIIMMGQCFRIYCAIRCLLLQLKTENNRSIGKPKQYLNVPNVFAHTFTGKERDAETGYSYFGARYYDSDLSGLFLSVDPMSDKYPSISPYAYCAWNPLKLVDPNGDTCKFANEETQNYVRQLLDIRSNNYSKDFSDIFNELDVDDHNYIFEIWEGVGNNDGVFSPKSLGNNTSSIKFTKGETEDTKNEWTGMSEFKILFEETYHAWKYKTNGHYQYSTCFSEALAWIFSAKAPGTKYLDSKGNQTYMGYVLNSDPQWLALEFKYGKPFSMFHNKDFCNELYPYLEVYPNNTFRKNIGYPEWH